MIDSAPPRPLTKPFTITHNRVSRLTLFGSLGAAIRNFIPLSRCYDVQVPYCVVCLLFDRCNVAV